MGKRFYNKGSNAPDKNPLAVRGSVYGGSVVLQAPPTSEIVREATSKNKIDLSGYGLSFDEANTKIQEAVEFTRREEQHRYDSVIKSLTNKINVLNLEVERLKKDLDIERLKSKSNTVSSNADLNTIKAMLMDLINSSENNGGFVDINDRVFIDITGDGSNMESRINVVSEEGKSAGDVMSDVDKLRKMIKRKD